MRRIISLLIWAALAKAVVQVCNPLEPHTECEPNPALGEGISEDFEEESEFFSNYTTTGRIEYGSDGAAFVLAKRLDNPALMSNFYIMYGKVEVELKAATGVGIVSSFYLQSDALDEIDFEWLGGDNGQFQTNFFSKGDVTTYARGAFHAVEQPQEGYHTYTIDWKMDETVWYLDGEPVRTLANDTQDGYPQTPMKVFMGIWAGGDPSNQPGTIQWAGGLADYSKAPFICYVKRVSVTDYSTGDEYVYTDKTGDWESIKAEGGSIYGRYEEAEEEFESLTEGREHNSHLHTFTSSSNGRVSENSESEGVSASKRSTDTRSESSSDGNSSTGSQNSTSSSATRRDATTTTISGASSTSLSATISTTGANFSTPIEHPSSGAAAKLHDFSWSQLLALGIVGFL